MQSCSQKRHSNN